MRARAPEILSIAGLGGALAVAALAPPRALTNGPVICPLRLLTGISCPTCGMTRSWGLTAHGDLAGAVAQHPLGPAVLVLAVVVLTVLVVHTFTNRWLVRPAHLSKTLAVLGVAAGVVWLVGFLPLSG